MDIPCVEKEKKKGRKRKPFDSAALLLAPPARERGRGKGGLRKAKPCPGTFRGTRRKIREERKGKGTMNVHVLEAEEEPTPKGRRTPSDPIPFLLIVLSPRGRGEALHFFQSEKKKQ